MQELEITWERALHVWWAFFWRCIAYVLPGSLVLGVAIAVIASLFNIDLEHYAWTLNALGFVVGFFVSWWVLKNILGKSFSGFRIALIASPSASTTARGPAPPPTSSDGSSNQDRSGTT